MKPHPIARLQGAASDFIDLERHKLEKAAHEKAITLIAILGFALLALVGAILLLLGLAFWLAPQLGTGPAFVLVGALVVTASLITAVALHASGKTTDRDHNH